MEKPLHHQWHFRHVPLIIRHQLVSPSCLIMHLQSSLTDSQDPPSPPQVIVIHIVHKVTLFQELVRLPIISAGCCSTMILESCCGCSPSLFIREHIFKPKSGWGCSRTFMVISLHTGVHQKTEGGWAKWAHLTFLHNLHDSRELRKVICN